MRPAYPLASQTWDDREVDAAVRVLQSGRTTMGEYCTRFEREFARYIGAEYAVMVNSGSSANLLMIAALVYSRRLPRGSEVAVPAVSWSTTYAPLEQYGMRMHVVDVDESLTIAPKQIPPCDAIFAVNLLGAACDYRRIMRDRSCILIEDNCEALGATYDGVQTGNLGVMASHSLFFSHHIHTMEGGVVTTSDEELWRMLLMLRAHGWTRHLPEYTPQFDSYEFRVPGFSMRPTEVQGAIGLEQLKKLPRLLDERRHNAEHYQRLFGGPPVHGESSWFWFPFLARDRAQALARLEPDFECRPIVAGNIMRHPMIEFFDVASVSDEYANHVHDCGVAIGNVGLQALEQIARLMETQYAA